MKDDLIWRALSDPTRRKILDLLRKQPLTTGALAKMFKSMTRIAVMKHIKILESAHLVFVRKDGKFRWNYLNPVPIQQIYERWVKPFEASWANQGLRLKEFIESKSAVTKPRNKRRRPGTQLCVSSGSKKGKTK